MLTLPASCRPHPAGLRRRCSQARARELRTVHPCSIASQEAAKDARGALSGRVAPAAHLPQQICGGGHRAARARAGLVFDAAVGWAGSALLRLCSHQEGSRVLPAPGLYPEGLHPAHPARNAVQRKRLLDLPAQLRQILCNTALRCCQRWHLGLAHARPCVWQLQMSSRLDSLQEHAREMTNATLSKLAANTPRISLPHCQWQMAWEQARIR